MRLFNRDGMGSEEIVQAVGLISNGVSFDKWEPLLPLGLRELAGIIGIDATKGIAIDYEEGETTEVVRLAQQATAFFTWLKIIPTLDAQHDESGRSRRLGENEKGLTALQEYKDEENIRSLAFEAVDALIEEMEVTEYEPWIISRKYKMRAGLLLPSKERFDEFFHIGSHRLFTVLIPMIREVQESEIAPVLGGHLAEILTDPEGETGSKLFTTAARATALLTMKKGVERLPVEVIPEGVVQVQQSQPVNQKLRAEQSARAAVAASLGADADRLLSRLQELVAAIDAPETESSKPRGPLVHTKGMSFA